MSVDVSAHGDEDGSLPSVDADSSIASSDVVAGATSDHDGTHSHTVLLRDGRTCKVRTCIVVDAVAVPTSRIADAQFITCNKRYKHSDSRWWLNVLFDKDSTEKDLHYSLPVDNVFTRIDAAIRVARGKPQRRLRAVDKDGQATCTLNVTVDGRVLCVANNTKRILVEASTENVAWLLSRLSVDIAVPRSPVDSPIKSLESEFAELAHILDTDNLSSKIKWAESRRDFLVARDGWWRKQTTNFHVRARCSDLAEEVSVQRKRACHFLETGEVLDQPPRS